MTGMRRDGKHGGDRGPVVPLQRLLDARGIPSARVEATLEERLESLNYPAPDRKQWGRWRSGKNTPRRKQMVWILWAVRVAAEDPTIRIDQLFDFDPDNPMNWP